MAVMHNKTSRMVLAKLLRFPLPFLRCKSAEEDGRIFNLPQTKVTIHNNAFSLVIVTDSDMLIHNSKIHSLTWPYIHDSIFLKTLIAFYTQWFHHTATTKAFLSISQKSIVGLRNYAVTREVGQWLKNTLFRLVTTSYTAL